jgi:hypothetical protein
MNFFKKYCFLVIVYLTVAPSIAAAEKLPEDDFEGFRNKGMHNFFEKFSQGNFLDLGFESLTENQQREEAGKEERELKKQAEEASRQERKQEKRRQAIETENKLKVFQELLEESQTKLTGAEAEKTQIMQQRNLANEKVKESEKLLKEFENKLGVLETEKTHIINKHNQANERAEESAKLLKEFQNKLGVLETEKTHIINKYNQANERVKEFEKLLKESQNKLGVARTESEKQRNLANKAINNLNKQIEDLKIQLEGTQKKLYVFEEPLIKAREAKEKELKLFTQLVGRGNEEIYRRFLNGVLIYRPDGKSDEGRINLPIASLANPLEGTFDLSQCGDTGKHLSISTGYRKVKKAENADKLEIWFTPRFLVEKELQGTASHFQGIFPDKWQNDAPVGIIWSRGDWENRSDNFDYLTTLSMVDISNNNLQDCASSRTRGVILTPQPLIGYGSHARCPRFMFIL